LKYWQALFVHTAEDGEPFSLAKESAEDVSRAAFVKDIARIERLVQAGGQGWVVALTNRARFWTAGRVDTSDAAFRLHDGASLSGSPMWRAGTSPITMKGTEALAMRGSYVCRWRDYSVLAEGPSAKLPYLALEVS
jgi:hypothetical protein